MMRKLLIPVLMLMAVSVHGQLNNSWINYSKTYYKFRIGKDTLTRIPQAVLASAGLGSTPADQFQLWRNGEQVRIYTSVASGTLGASDYIEFWGQMNDGKPDKQLYKDPAFQLADKYSLETDTVAYFLTVNSTGGNFRFTNAPNNPPGSMIPDQYFMRSVDKFYRDRINRGLANVVGEYVYSSSYDEGEGWSSGDIYPCCVLSQSFFNMNVYTAGPANSLSVRVNASGNANNPRDLVVTVYGSEVYKQGMPFFNSKKANITGLPISLLQSPNQNFITAATNSSTSTDRIAVASIGITYPATFNFNNEKSFAFDLAAAPSGNYLIIDNFNYGSVAPVLYDITTGARYTGDISTPGKVKFVLPSSAQVRKFQLVSQESSNINNVNSLVTRNFINYGNTSAQGDYLIISNPMLYNDGNGNNYVDQYRLYRNSVAGGSFNTKIYNIDELNDQFAFGVKKHPGAIRDFIRYANQGFAVKPKFVFLIGRGINYIDHRSFEGNVLTDKMDLVPTFGWPASDVLLAAIPGTVTPLIPMGRLSAINGTEIFNYLEKIKQYDQAQQTPGSTIASKAWMKNMINVAGGKDSAENDIFKQYMNGYKKIAEDTLFGGYVETFTKTATGAVQQANSQRIQDLFQEGLGFIGYFGHSSANTFEFNLSNPELYNNAGKYPFFNVSGCSAGNFFIFDPLRLNGNLTLSEKYVLAPQRGSIGFLADTHFGIPPFLNFYNDSLYTKFAKTMYGDRVGNQIKEVVKGLGGNNPNLDFFTRIHLEEIALHGDPAVKINSFPKPDYVIEEQLIRISPNIITVADNNFNVTVRMQNIGKATGDSIWVSVKRKLPNDSIRVLYNRLIPGIKYADSINLSVAINPVTDKGLNQLIVTLDHTNKVNEIFETNNTITKDFYVFEDELRPSYPYNFSIVNQQNITYVANTANPLSGMRQYTMEVDTTELFNSAFKKIYNTGGVGGIVEFKPTNINFTDSTVYYWRVSMVPLGGQQIIWNAFSFTYLNNSSPGFSQSHYYQFKKSSFDKINLQQNRTFSFEKVPRSLTIRTGLYPFYDYDRINVNLDFDPVEIYGCNYNSIQVYVFDSTTLQEWRNRKVTNSNGLYGSNAVCINGAILPDTTRAFFEFNYTNFTTRQAAMNFIENVIPTGKYVAITNLGRADNNTSFINQWQADQAILGAGKSLYHTLKNIGFTKIDSFTKNLPFLYFYQKGISGYSSTQTIGPADSSFIEQSFALNSTFTNGTVESPVYGPVKAWQSLHMRGFTNDPAPSTDTTKIQVYGIKYDGSTNLITTVSSSVDTTLGFINAQVYPYLKLKMTSKDVVNATPYQLRHLLINASLAPEGAVAPNILFKMKDSVDQGEMIDFALAFKNISQTKFDSLLKIKFIITDKDNVPHVLNVPKGKALIAGDTLTVQYSIDTRNYPGTNTLFIDFNPDNDQPEQYHFNNILYKNFFVRTDKFNPLLDITFDGVRILNKDIVSSKPGILIKLKDESRFLALKDTSLINVMVRYPDQTLHNYYFGDTMRFNPADLSTGENTASIDFKPYFPEDGEYELIISGKDAAGNKAGELEFRVVFNVINKPMISNLLNYPNPFTTSTAFVFTITGSEVPQNMRIQVLTITGKIVREITKDELGPIQIGRNITEFKWDGTDMYGQKLANGVYIYRVLTNLNGKKLDRFDGRNSNGTIITEGINGTDKYFNKGYGKMYLMR
ncbi:MAG: C25 family cysteine peptidase [Ferruginibacter sp.]